MFRSVGTSSEATFNGGQRERFGIGNQCANGVRRLNQRVAQQGEFTFVFTLHALCQIAFRHRHDDLGRLFHGAVDGHLVLLCFRDVAGVLDYFVGFAVEVADGIVGSLDPDFLATLANALVFARVVFAAIHLFPESPVFRRGGVGWIDEGAVMLALDLVQRVAKQIQEIFIGGDDFAIQANFDSAHRFADGGKLALEIGVAKFRCGDAAGVFDHLDRLAVQVADRVVGGLYPDFLAALANALVFASIVFTTV